MKKTLTLFAILSMFAVCCNPTVQPDEEDPDKNPSEITDPEEKEDEKKEDVVSLHDAFTEEFDAKESAFFSFSYYEDTSKDFRFYPAFPSWNQSKKNLLMLRIDPAAPSGVNSGIEFSSREHTFYGSYAIRMRFPDVVAVQANTGLKAVFSIYEQEDEHGYSKIELTWKLADLSYIYYTAQAGVPSTNNFVKDPISSFKPSGAYYTYGFDWHSDKVSWWIDQNGTKTVIAEEIENVPFFPARIKFNWYHSQNNPVESNTNAKLAPSYPFELEIDSISYTPFSEEVQAWTDEYYSK